MSTAKRNDALRGEQERRRRRRLLGEMLERLDAEHGPVDATLVEKYLRILAAASPSRPIPTTSAASPPPTAT